MFWKLIEMVRLSTQTYVFVEQLENIFCKELLTKIIFFALTRRKISNEPKYLCSLLRAFHSLSHTQNVEAVEGSGRMHISHAYFK